MLVVARVRRQSVTQNRRCLLSSCGRCFSREDFTTDGRGDASRRDHGVGHDRFLLVLEVDNYALKRSARRQQLCLDAAGQTEPTGVSDRCAVAAVRASERSWLTWTTGQRVRPSTVNVKIITVAAVAFSGMAASVYLACPAGRYSR